MTPIMQGGELRKVAGHTSSVLPLLVIGRHLPLVVKRDRRPLLARNRDGIPRLTSAGECRQKQTSNASPAASLRLRPHLRYKTIVCLEQPY